MGVQWRDWSRAAFLQAKRGNKPILLHITGTWCVLGHEMEQRTYNDPVVANLINKHVVAIKVDTDKRPDINQRYNQGGWPSTVLLDHDGSVLDGGLFIPPEMMAKRVQVAVDKVKGGSRKPLETLAFTGMRLGHGELAPATVDKIASLLRTSFDSTYGGFGSEPKFPHPDALEFCLRLHARTCGLQTTKQKPVMRSPYLSMVEKSITGMKRGLLDTRGGWFRYSISRDWREPHREKLLDTNAALLRMLSLTYQQTKKKQHLDLARKTATYLLRNLADPDGGLYAGQITAQQKKAQVDTRIFVDKNGHALVAFLDYFTASKDRRARRAVLQAFERLETAYNKKRGFAHYIEGKRVVHLGWLPDSVAMGRAYVALYQALERGAALRKAQEIAEIVETNFLERGGGFLDRIGQKDDVGKLEQQQTVFSLNVQAAQFYLDLFDATGDAPDHALAKLALESVKGVYRIQGVLGAGFGIAVDRLVNKAVSW
ncbi:MAG: DUF255 domain-containing protein [Nanoarchaeota archaeon]|nr:DUF255 domain-containing protein [Nanoarchaeota archaeon]